MGELEGFVVSRSRFFISMVSVYPATGYAHSAHTGICTPPISVCMSSLISTYMKFNSRCRGLITCYKTPKEDPSHCGNKS
jgi:hypothetical protein